MPLLKKEAKGTLDIVPSSSLINLNIPSSDKR